MMNAAPRGKPYAGNPHVRLLYNRTMVVAGAAAMMVAVGCIGLVKNQAKPWSGTARYVDAERGDDANDGLSPEKAWKTLTKVNVERSLIAPGDAVLFRRGCMWRGTLDVVSGEPGKRTYYGAYGEGPKPILQGSVCRGAPSDWFELKPGLWSTRTQVVETVGMLKRGSELTDFRCSCENGIRAKAEVVKNAADGEYLHVACAEVPEKPMLPNHFQLWGGVKLDRMKLPVLLKFRTRGDFRPQKIDILTSCAPWVRASEGVVAYAGKPSADGWTDAQVMLNDSACEQVGEGALHVNLGQQVKTGGTCDLKFVSLESVKPDRTKVIGKDVGIVLFGGEETWGFKKWGLDQLKNDLDYWYDDGNDRVIVKLDRNPAEVYGPVELCKTWTIVPHARRHDVTVEALTIRYTAGFAFGGGGAENFTVRNCDMYFIGGGLQHMRREKDGTLTPVRYGNGIEYWGDAKNCLVERCRLWQVYDAAITPQYDGGQNLFDGLVFRDNVIWQAEYSFEFWNHSKEGRTYNIIFEHNTCVDAGYCWSHSQRPIRHSTHLMAYHHYGSMSNQVIRNCLFVRAAERDLQYYNHWHDKLSIDYNLYYEPLNTLCEKHASADDLERGIKPWLFTAGPKEFARYQAECGDERHSLYAEPQFVNEKRRDYRLVPGTPGTNAASDGSDMGARDMPGLDEDQSIR